MRLPSLEECRVLHAKFHTPKHVTEHTERVAQVAVFIADGLKENGLDVNVDLVRMAALLHDLFRFLDFKDPERFPEAQGIWQVLRKKYAGLDHEHAAYEYLKGDYPELARAILTHGYSCLETDDAPVTWEEKIVSYADKRVMHEKVVTLSQRFEDGRQRNGYPLTEKSRRIDSKYMAFEKEIFSRLGMAPEDIERHLNGQRLL
jgi:uncharacterized protein